MKIAGQTIENQIDRFIKLRNQQHENAESSPGKQVQNMMEQLDFSNKKFMQLEDRVAVEKQQAAIGI